jgi:two-component system OmpR family response regulator
MVLDITVPRPDGLGVLQRMRAAGASKRCKTLVLTARNQPDDVRRAIALGASDFLAKPFEDAQLIQRGRRLLRPRLARPTPASLEAPPPSLLTERPRSCFRPGI